MENLAINSLLPASTDASQTMGKDANAGDGKSFMDALSGLMKNTHGKKDKQEASEAVEPASESAEEISGQADPAAGISVLVSSLEHITPGGSVDESAALAMAGMISAGTAGMQGEMPVDESGSADPRLAGSTDAAINQVMNSRLAVAAQTGATAQSTSATRPEEVVQSGENASAILVDRGEKPGTGSGVLALSEGRRPNESSIDESMSAEKFGMPGLADTRQAFQDRTMKSQSGSQELRISERQAARESSTQNLTAQNMSPQGISSQTQAAFQLGIGQPTAADMASASQIAPRVGASGWSEAMGQRIVMMASENVQQAEIRLNPEGLGPMQVVLSLEKGAADVQFLAHDAQVREALQAALPKLQEMLSSAGFSLDKVSIDSGSAKNQGSQGNAEQFQQQRRGSGQSESETAAMPVSRVIVQSSPGRIDTFA